MGISFKYASGIDQKIRPAIVGSGVIFVDYDDDGELGLDLYLVNTDQPHES